MSPASPAAADVAIRGVNTSKAVAISLFMVDLL
jgi:hypothetical protein